MQVLLQRWLPGEGGKLLPGSELAIGWFRDIATMDALVRREESSGGLVITQPRNKVSSTIH
jgi:hypothetical protein